MNKNKTHLFTALFTVFVLLFSGNHNMRHWYLLVIPALLCWLYLMWQNHKCLFRDAVFWLGCSFLVLVSVQALRNGFVTDDLCGVPEYSTLIPFGLSKDLSIFWWAVWFGLFVLLLMLKYINGNLMKQYAIALGLIVIIFGAWNFTKVRQFGLFEYVNNAGTFMVLICAMSLARYKWMNLIVVPIIFLSASIGHCRFAMVTIPVLVTYKFTPREFKTIVLISIAGGLSVTLFHSIDYLMADRWQEVVTAWCIIKEFPLFGAGGSSQHFLSLAFSPSYIADIYRAGQPDSHNDWLMFVSEYGIVGLSLLVSVACACLWRIRRRSLGCVELGILMVFLHSMIDMPLHCPSVLALLIACMRPEEKL